MSGEQLPAEAFGPGRIVNLLELHELEKTLPHDRTVHRMRNGAAGVWSIPSMGASSANFEGRFYAFNKWGDTSMGIGFGRTVDLEGAWIAGHSNPSVWTSGLVVVGYRGGLEVGRTARFTDIDETPTWFAMDLGQVDRVVFEAEAVVGGAGWYALDGLTYSARRTSGGFEPERVRIDFEDLDHKFRLTGSGYAGLDWETGAGEFDQDPRAIDQPLTFGDEDEGGVQGQEGGGGQFFGGGGTAPNLLQDFEGAKLFDPGAGYIPPDTCGAVGLSHFLEVVNTNLSVFERGTQNRVVNIALSTFFGTGDIAGDPRAVFDPHSQRWFILATNFNDRIFIGVSLSSDPTGSFYTNHFLTSQGIDSGKFPDYETLGVDANGVYTGAAMFGGGATMTIFALDKAPLIAAAPSLGTVTAFRGFSFEGAIQPCVTYGNPGREYFISRKDSNELRLREITGPLTSPTLTDLGTVSIPSHNFPPDADSMGSSVPLDSVDHRPMNAVFRNGSVWTIHTVGVNGRSAARWYEVNPLTTSTVQVGTIDDPVLAYIMPSIAVNSAGDAVMGFSGASSSQFAASYYTGRSASDPLGQVAPPVRYKPGEGAYERVDGAGRNRWGDYSLTSVDPVDDLRFWTVQEYARTGNDWGTWMAELEYAPTITDCNSNGIDDATDIANGTSQDCNSNSIPDECDIAAGTSNDCNSNGIPDECESGPDCNANGIPDECETDCNSNGVPDDCDIAAGTSNDCNSNGIPDECESGPDCNANGIPDECETDCNSNGVPDDCDIAAGTSDDCNSNGIPDECESGPDCNANGIPDECETDCNSNGVPDDCDIAAGTSDDCNSNGIPDECESGADCNANGIPDECETDCNSNGVPDDCDISAGTSDDCNSNGIPDECESGPDCNANGIPDECETDCNSNGVPDDCDISAGTSDDCNSNGIPDECESGPDCNANGIPDECETDCNSNGVPDDCDISAGTSDDCNSNGIPDECETDCNSNGVPDDCDISAGTSDDCNSNGIPDECESGADCNANGIPDECETDCNSNGVPDDCDIAAGTSDDCNSNGIPDECESGTDCNANGVPDECETDCNSNGVPDDCDISAGTSNDCNSNGIPDECESGPDCNANGIPDECETDCNSNGVPDDCDIAAGTSGDCNSNGIPDECESGSDCNANGIPDECETDCNANGVPDDCDIAAGTSDDDNSNGVPDECECLAQNYCSTAPNSVGSGGLITFTGSTSVSANDLVLRANSLPTGQFGAFYFGPNQIQVPFGDGFRCVGGDTIRLPVQQTTVAGTAVRALDLNNLPSGAIIVSGDVVNFQFWYRDPGFGGSGYNLTDAIAFTFCD